jgi:ADP-heptose:LPS heptosyltransferase
MIKNDNASPKRFLIIKTSSLGDIVHAFTALNYLKTKFPNALVDWVVEKQFAELVRAHPLVNQTLCIETKKWRKGWLKNETLAEMKAFRYQVRATAYDASLRLHDLIRHPRKIFAKITLRLSSSILVIPHIGTGIHALKLPCSRPKRLRLKLKIYC